MSFIIIIYIVYDIMVGQKVSQYLDSDQEILQQADCYVSGLTALPFHDINQPTTTTYSWAVELARNYQAINEELRMYDRNHINIMNVDKEWLPPRDAVGN